MASKVVLKSTTKLSLNERFSAYRKNVASYVGSTANIRARIQQMQQASARNRRLAIQMENRPSVIAALKLKKKSLKQRLGTTTTQQFRGVGTRGGNRLGVRGVFRRGFARRDSVRIPNTVRRGAGMGGAGSGRRSMRRGRGMGSGRGRGGGGVGGSPGSMQQFGSRGQQRNSRGGFRGRGRGRGGRGGQKVPTKQELDIELEQYMANSRTQLDSELDAYMADAS